MVKNIINIDDLDWATPEEQGDFTYAEKVLGLPTNAEKLGATLYKIMPGKKAFPYHCHFANEEAAFILEGEGSLRLNGETHAIRKGDYISFPSGPHHAHQIINTSQQPLIFLCFSTMQHPEVCFYPDSQKSFYYCGHSVRRPAGESAIKGGVKISR